MKEKKPGKQKNSEIQKEKMKYLTKNNNNKTGRWKIPEKRQKEKERKRGGVED